jgi:selenophosphate synthetase-related protein
MREILKLNENVGQLTIDNGQLTITMEGLLLVNGGEWWVVRSLQSARVSDVLITSHKPPAT